MSVLWFVFIDFVRLNIIQWFTMNLNKIYNDSFIDLNKILYNVEYFGTCSK